MTEREQLLERAKESTAKLTWLDTMIKHYTALQWHTHEILELMNAQTRHDDAARVLLHDTYALTMRKLERLNDARDKHFAKHDVLMNNVIYGGE